MKNIRIEYVIVGFVLLLVLLLVAITMLGGVGNGMRFIAELFSRK